MERTVRVQGEVFGSVRTVLPVSGHSATEAGAVSGTLTAREGTEGRFLADRGVTGTVRVETSVPVLTEKLETADRVPVLTADGEQIQTV